MFGCLKQLPGVDPGAAFSALLADEATGETVGSTVLCCCAAVLLCCCAACYDALLRCAALCCYAAPLLFLLELTIMPPT